MTSQTTSSGSTSTFNAVVNSSNSLDTFRVTRNKRIRLDSSTSAQITEDHEVRVLQNPDPESEGDETIETDGQGETSGITKNERMTSQTTTSGSTTRAANRSAVPRTLLKEHVTEWNYFGRPIENDLDMSYERLKLKNYIYHMIKQYSGGLNVHVEEELKKKPARFHPVTEVTFKVYQLKTRGNKPVKQQFGCIVVTTEDGKDTYYRFVIQDQVLAENNNVDVQMLKQACEVVFSTVVMRCEEKDGLSPKDFAEHEADAVKTLVAETENDVGDLRRRKRKRK